MIENTVLGYEGFKNQLKEMVEQNVKEGTEVYFHVLQKNNGKKKEVLGFRVEGESIMTLIHLQELYDDYQDQGNMEGIVDEVKRILKQKININPKELLESWEKFRGRVAMKLVNYEWNKEVVEKLPHKRLHDLAVIFQLKVKENFHESTRMTINKEVMRRWGIDEAELWEAAMENLRNEQYTITDMEEIMEEILGIKMEPEDKMGMQYVLTNEKKKFGAAGIFRDDLLKEFAEKIDGNFYIIPSSIHELILMPEKCGFTPEMLNNIVKEINENEVAEEERLGDNVYYYDRETGRIEM